MKNISNAFKLNTFLKGSRVRVAAGPARLQISSDSFFLDIPGVIPGIEMISRPAYTQMFNK